ncbi:MAG: ATP synthase subunit C [Candidatus Lokiarchaeia archaeon]|nr:ATP synthase subunit C [Candidatus Lokiarchaeia archaeon]
MKPKNKFYLLLGLYQVILVLIVFFSINGLVTFVSAQASTYDYYNTPTAGLLGIGAGLAIGLSAIGGGMAIKTVGTAVISAMLEREESFGKAFIVVALGEALAIYGLIVAILLWTKIPSIPAGI